MTDEQRELIEGVIEGLIQDGLDRDDAGNAPAVKALRTLLVERDRLGEELVDMANFLDVDICATVESARRRSERIRRLVYGDASAPPGPRGGG